MKIFNHLLSALCVLSLTQVNAQCAASGSHYTASYPSGWNYTDLGDNAATTSSSCTDNKNGSIYSTGNAAYFFSAKSGRELRISTGIPAVSNTNWTMDFTLQVTTNAGILASNSPAVVLASLTADPQSLVTSCSTSSSSFCTPCSSYSETNMDAIWVELISDAPSTCSESQTGKNWRIVAHARDGNGSPTTSSSIAIPSGNGTYYVRLQRTSDNSGMVGVYSNSNYQAHLSGSPQCLAIPAGLNGLDALNHEILSQQSCQRVFNGVVSNLKIDNSVTCPLALNPSFTMPTSICGVQPFAVNAAASTSGTSISIANHLWAVQECYSNGNQFGPVWYSSGQGTNLLNNYTINPSAVLAGGGPNMQPGHYYKISLIVQNCGNPWSAASHVLYVNPFPTISMAGSSTTTTTSGGANLALAMSGGTGPYSLSIYTNGFPPNGYLLYQTNPGPYNGVTQYSPTTYYIVGFDIGTGCRGYTTWHIGTGNTPQINAVFSATPILLNADEFTLETYPADVSGNPDDGFEYSHIIEELDANGDPYYSLTSPECWTSYPEFETFKGFASTGTGTYGQSTDPANCGTAGRFLIGHTYRVTTVMSTPKDAAQYSVIIYFEKSGQFVVKEDKNAPDMTNLLAGKTPEAAIFPNPGKGIFTIELEEGTEASLIEVTNSLGQKVKSFQQKELRSELNMTGCTKGIYFVTITTNGSSVMKKIILE